MSSPSPEPPRPPSRDLPAPYVDPWTRLAVDLQAVLASLRLRVWELWRRNRQGDLAVPALWPAPLAAWFWPLLLAAVLALLLAIALRLVPTAAPGPANPAGQPAGHPAASAEAPAGAPAADPAIDGPDAAPAAGIRAVDQLVAEEPVVEEPVAMPPPEAAAPSGVGRPGSRRPSSRTTASDPVGAATPADDALNGIPERVVETAAIAPPPLDPLQQALMAVDPGGWVLAIEPDPARARLLVRLRSGWPSLPERQRQASAEAWQQQTLAAGYEQLRLRDPQDHLLARSALVGSGMILLNPGPAADVPRS